MGKGLSRPWMLMLMLGGCAGQPDDVTSQHVAAHGHDPGGAERRALQKAAAPCPAGQLAVLGRKVHPAPPTFGDLPPASPPQSETDDLAAATHEGESPAIRLGFRCD